MNLSSAIERTPSPALRAASVRVSRQVRAVPERVFDAWLDAGQARRFLFANRVWDAISAKIDARVGGDFRIVRQWDGEDVEYCGEYLEVDRPHRLVFSLFIEKYAHHDDRVIVELAQIAGRSLLVLTHELSLPDPLERSRIGREWARVLERLAALLDGARH
ncbi:MAG TPA: SRPBCC family protein [Steroidobacteraceae bacterium]|nr:SRPBCC family protein [Steroidobacteraceae bacterium]